MRRVTPNEFVCSGDKSYVSLVLPPDSGRYVRLDAEDFDKVRHLRWQVGPRGHVSAHEHRTTVYLARFLLGLSKLDKKRVRYANGDLLDCRRSNLTVIDWPPCASRA